MSTADDTKKWNNITTIAFVVAIVAGVAVGVFTDAYNAVYTILIVFGCYFSIAMYIRDDTRKTGPSSADGAIAGGVLLAGIGVCGFLYYYSENVIATSVAIIAVMLVAAGIMIVRNRRFL